MAITEVYVDPSIAGDSGTGTIGDPYGDLEYAIEQTTFDTTNGTRVNIKAGTAEVLAAKLETALADTVTTPAWAPSASAHLYFQGYTAVAGDGGVATIDGNGLVGMFEDVSLDYTTVRDIKIQNCGANGMCLLDNYCSIINVEAVGDSSTTAFRLDLYGQISDCYVHGSFSDLVIYSAAAPVRNSYIDVTITTNNAAIYLASGAVGSSNIVVLNGTEGKGIQCVRGNAINNSIYCSGAGTREGILSAATFAQVISNNLVEGFTGVGGTGISLTADGVISGYRGNGVYNCTTAYTDAGAWISIEEDNETLTASPFTDAANGDFSPVDTGNVKEGSLPQVIGGGLV